MEKSSLSNVSSTFLLLDGSALLSKFVVFQSHVNLNVFLGRFSHPIESWGTVLLYLRILSFRFVLSVKLSSPNFTLVWSDSYSFSGSMPSTPCCLGWKCFLVGQKFLWMNWLHIFIFPSSYTWYFSRYANCRARLSATSSKIRNFVNELVAHIPLPQFAYLILSQVREL